MVRRLLLCRVSLRIFQRDIAVKYRSVMLGSVYIVLLCLLQSVSGGYTPKVTYGSYTRDITISEASYGTAKPLSVVSNSDDTPFEEIELPFAFPFFGEDTYRLHASPNGGLFLSKEPPCGLTFGAHNCGLNEYTGVVGPLMTDFDASDDDNSTVQYFVDANEVYISYENFREFGHSKSTAHRFNFSVSVFSDGSIIIKYQVIPDLSNTDWVSTIRPKEPYANTFQLTTAQTASSPVPGVYPDTEDVISGQEVLFCPISTTWCLTPSSVNVNSLPTEFIFTPLSMSCVTTIGIGYYISTMGIDHSVPCAFNISDGTPKYICNASAIASEISVGSIDIKLAWWKPPSDGGSTGTFIDLEIDPFVVIVDPTDSESCFVNTKACGDDSCNLCQYDLACLDLPCEVMDNMSYSFGFPDLYANTSCDGTCGTVYELDREDVCCNNEFIDCFGVCNGTAITALDPDGSDEYVCCLSGYADCFNRCDGEGSYDTCGVCRLPGDTGPECETYFDVDTGNEDGIMYEFYSLIDGDIGVTPLYNLTFNNSNVTEVVMTMELFGSDDDYGPEITLPTQPITVPAMSSIIVPVLSSITGLLSGNMTRWEAKTIRVTFGRPSVFSYQIALDIKFYPDTKNCSVITDRSTCISLPGCMHCYRNPGYRVLYAQEEDCSLEGNESVTNSSNQCKRSLFSTVIPSSTNANIGEPEKDGICQNGWRSAECRTYEQTLSNGVEESSIVKIVATSIAFFGVFGGVYVWFS